MKIPESVKALIAPATRPFDHTQRGLLQRLAHVYLSPDVEFPPESVRNQTGFITHIVPERFTGNGNWSK